jgi:glycosyltransferase involved in cell wall biosynthesis
MISPEAARASVVVLEAHDWSAWSALHARGEVAGELGPYGAEQLERHGFALRWSDAAHRAPLHSPLVGRPLRKLATLRPELAGVREALASLRAVAQAQLVLALFEDQGMAPALARARGLAPFASRPLVLAACWLAETCRNLDESQLRAYRRALAGVDRVCCFSRNQSETLARELGVEADRFRYVPFGIDDRFFSPCGGQEEGYVLAVGRDRARDHRLLLEAVRGTDVRVRLISPSPELAALAPPNVEVMDAVDHRTYRELLARAAVVAVPTLAPRYPSGQTVVLEAMAMGKAVLTTDSPAMRDYVEPGGTGLLVPPGDRGALAEALVALLRDASCRRALGTAARAAVEREFNHRTMWTAFAGVFAELAAPPAGTRNARRSAPDDGYEAVAGEPGEPTPRDG